MNVAKLLVSVRSVEEAVAALDGGAAVIDVKEPDRGPLGRADLATWQAVRRVVPSDVPLSVALGELREWTATGANPPDATAFSGVHYRKLGLAGAGATWTEDWGALRRAWGPGPLWVAVAYADWSLANAPHPDVVLEAALAATDCAGVLVDTWNKAEPSPIDGAWMPWIARARRGGRQVVLAGGLDAQSIARLAPLRPDLFAVRGAACLGGERRAKVDVHCVRRLARAVRDS